MKQKPFDVTGINIAVSIYITSAKKKWFIKSPKNLSAIMTKGLYIHIKKITIVILSIF